MLKIFLSSHGHFASGMQSSLQIILGKIENLTVFDAYVDESSLQEQLDAFYADVTAEDRVILVSDQYGGSVNAEMFLYTQRPDTTLVTGVNMAFMLELCTREGITDDELESLVETSRSMLRIVGAETAENAAAPEKDDFF